MQIGSIAFSQGTSMNQLVAPLFILMAEALARGDIAKDIFTVLSKLLRRIKAGLALSTMLASTIFAALCGSSPATAAAMGRISISEMIQRGYRQDFAAGVVGAGGTLGIMIPPSISLVIFGIITENSIAKLFMAGVLPGLLLSGLLCLFILVRVKLRPELVEQTGSGSVASPTSPTSQKRSGPIRDLLLIIPPMIFRDLLLIIPPMILIVIVLGSLYTGMTTPTEAAGFGAIGALILVILGGRMTLKKFTLMMSATARTSSMILFLIIGGMALSYVVSHLGIAQQITELIVGSGLNRWIVMILIYILWFFLGCLMDPLSMIVLTIPFIYPAILALGFDPLWLGIVSTLCVEIGMITPPVGLNLFVLKAITDVPMGQIMMGALPFVLVLIVGLILFSIFPQIALFLPSLM
jgi:C4-dicarboxylate transporter DctM subunit